jgi:hypothetical protein
MPIFPKASVPPIPMGRLTTLLLLPPAILFLPVTPVSHVASEFASRG